MPTESNFASKLTSNLRLGKNITTFVLLGGLGLLGFYYWGLVVPFFIDVASNTLKLVGLCAALFAAFYVVADPKMRNLVSYIYSSFTRLLTSFFIEIDPIGILNTYVSRLKDRIAEMDKAIADLRGVISGIATRIMKKQEEHDLCMQRAKAARAAADRGGDNADEMRGEFTLNARQAGRLEESIKKASADLVRFKKLLTESVKMRGVSNVLMRDMENSVQSATDDYKAARAASSVAKRVQSIMADGGAEKELVDMTFAKLADDYAAQMGEIDNVLELSKSVSAGVDLDNMVFDQRAMDQLDAWDKKVRVATDDGGATLEAAAHEEAAASSDGYDDLFNAKKG